MPVWFNCQSCLHSHWTHSKTQWGFWVMLKIFGILQPKFVVPFLTNRSFDQIREFGKEIKSGKSHSCWLVRFNRSIFLGNSHWSLTGRFGIMEGTQMRGEIIGFFIIKQVKKPRLCPVQLWSTSEAVEHARNREKHCTRPCVFPYISFVLYRFLQSSVDCEQINFIKFQSDPVNSIYINTRK